MNSEYPSQLLENAVNQFASLPGIGRKTSLRLVLNLLRRSQTDVLNFTNSLVNLKNEVKYCRICHNISDTDVCSICSSTRRNRQLVCVVENIQDVMSIERTGQYNGLYHVLGGVISPIEGVGPNDIEVESLVSRIVPEQIEEVVFALPATIEGDTTNYYIYKRLQPFNIITTQIARGVAVGNELEYTDEITLGRSIINRTEFKG
ncbi:MAG: recombination protein RecR [Paludibacteraceae bacterium]|nr:recombination protein RecR [Paludibacteraceae bacterium]